MGPYLIWSSAQKKATPKKLRTLFHIDRRSCQHQLSIRHLQRASTRIPRDASTDSDPRNFSTSVGVATWVTAVATSPCSVLLGIKNEEKGQGIPPLYSRPAMSFETLRKTQNAKMDVHSSIISSAYHRPTLVGQAEVGLGRARRPGPAQKIFRGWATARPGPANFRGFAAAQPSPSHFQNFTARPGPSFFPKSRPGPAHFMAAKPMRHGLYMG